MIHELKIAPEYYRIVVTGVKRFELRKDDRGFKSGDTLYLREFDGKVYTGNIVFKKIGFILRDTGFGLRKDFCILQFL